MSIPHMKKTLLIIGILIVLIVLYIWSSYNGLIVMREDTTVQWHQVETQYQRRFDLIPNLVESTKGIMKQEQTIFTAIADARTKYAGAQTVSDKAAAASQVETALGRLLVVMENYPVLKSSDTVRDLMVAVEGTENRIGTERGRYNEAVKAYQVTIHRFPGTLVASLFGFEDIAYFEAQTGAENAPKVNLQ